MTDYDNNGVKDYSAYMSPEIQACFEENWASYESSGVHVEGSGTNGGISGGASGGASASASSTMVIETGHEESPEVDVTGFDSFDSSSGSSSGSWSFSSSSSTTYGEPEVTDSSAYYSDYYDYYESDSDYYSGSDEFNYYYSS